MSVNDRNDIRIEPDKTDPVLVEIIGENFIESLRAKNISLGGLNVKVPHRFGNCKIDKEVELIITLPYSDSFKALGRIMHVQHGGIYFGVKFTRLDKAAEKALNQYIDSFSNI